MLVLSGFWPTVANPITGIFVVQQTRAFAEAGYCVTVMVPWTVGRGNSRSLTVRECGLDPERVVMREFPILRAPELLSRVTGVSSMNMILVGVAVRAALRKHLAGNAAISGCIVHGLRYLGCSAPLWRQQVKAPVIAVVHGVNPGLKRGGKIIDRHIARLVERCEERLDRVVLVGSFLCNHVEELGFSREKCTIVLNGTELPDSNGHERQRVQAPNALVGIVSVSNLIDWKGIDKNIEALSRLSTEVPTLAWEYRIVGDGPERSYLEALVVERRMTAHVTFMGRLDYDATMQEIADSDVFSLPSCAEAFGIVYLEAMARYRPVIGCLDNGPGDFVTNDVDGLLVPPHDINALSAALKRLLNDPDLRERLGEAARKTAETHSWGHNARAMLDLLGLSYPPIVDRALRRKLTSNRYL